MSAAASQEAQHSGEEKVSNKSELFDKCWEARGELWKDKARCRLLVHNGEQGMPRTRVALPNANSPP